MRRTHATVIMLAMAGTVGCRDGLGPYETPTAPTDSTAVAQLTRSPGNDLYPAWSRDGAAIVYSGAGFAGVPAGQGLLLELSREGGAAGLVFEDLQGPGAGGPRWLAGSAISPDQDAVAYIQIAAVSTAAPVDPAVCNVPEPVLDSVVVRVRRRGETGSILADPAHELRLPGRDPGMRAGAPGPFDVRNYPFQQRFLKDSTLAVRPSWSPDNRVVFSDGLRLWIWTPGNGSPVAVPGVDDAVTPAWSPDGSRIAYTRLERGDSIRQTCNIVAGNTVVQHNRTTYTWPRSVITVMQADGTGRIELTEGSDPAWSPDGNFIYYRGNGRIERVAATAGPTEFVPGTDDGWWPAVSPDGTRLLFMRTNVQATWDIWSAPLSF
jgi:hypothetical protein